MSESKTPRMYALYFGSNPTAYDMVRLCRKLGTENAQLKQAVETLRQALNSMLVEMEQYKECSFWNDAYKALKETEWLE